jgi:hypothetical protein
LNNIPAFLFHTLITGSKPQQWKKTIIKRKIKNQKNHKQNDLTRNLDFSPFLAASTKNEERVRRRHRNQYPPGGG